MDKINNISFTGIKNVAACQFQRNRQSFSTALSMCLTDDVNGKDLSEFHSMVKKVATKPNQFEHYNGSDVVNIEHYAQNDGTALFLNGDEVKINDENLPVLSFIAKKTRQIFHLPKEKMIVNNEYKTSDGVGQNLMYGIVAHFRDPEHPERTDLYDTFFDTNVVKSIARDINQSIQKKMNIYFDV